MVEALNQLEGDLAGKYVKWAGQARVCIGDWRSMRGLMQVLLPRRHVGG